MPAKTDLLKSLRDDYERLKPFDSPRLKRVRARSEMLIARIFGADSRYLQQIQRIEFSRNIPFAVSTSGFSTPPSDLRREERRRTWYAGQQEAVALIDVMLEDLELGKSQQPPDGESPKILQSDRVFVVHGHDDGMRESVARMLSSLGLEPVILHEQPERGRTIIEKFYEHSDVGFAVVLLSPDDLGYSNNEGSDSAKPRARQNVILELGFFLGRLGRESVVALHKGDVEIPSDFSGVLYKRYDSDGAWQLKLTRELRASGYNVSADDL